MKTSLLILSMVLNVALTVYVISGAVSLPEVRADEVPRPSLDGASSFAANGGLDAPALQRLLEQHGMADRETKAIVFAYLNAAAFERDVTSPYAYWRADDRHGAAARLEEAERNGEAVRKSLAAIYGPQAQEDPAFARAFRPLQERMPFLSSQQQLALRRLQLERRAAGPVTISSIAPDSASGPAAASGQDASIRRILQDEATYREYAMRESPLAYRLRAAGVEFTEREYRAVFELMDQFRVGPSPAAFVSQRKAVRNVLGRDRALRLWAATDPVFQAIRQASERHGVRGSTVLDAYETVIDAQDDLMAMSAGPRDLRQAEYIRERIEQRDSALRSLVGEAAAKGLIEAIGVRFGGLRSLPTAQALSQ